ncbi:MAG TPA: AhpC/TSA family protein, partial [Thermoanaerobaculia bacterium]|nr:AhpC/TSA family protein [Thermoanaerobaculia bacterium]
AVFRRELEVRFPVICDQERVLFKKFGLREMTLIDVFSPRVLAKTVKVIFNGGYGHKFGQGSESQLGGAFLIDAGGTIRFAHRAADAADHPSTDDLLQAAAMLDEVSRARQKSRTRKTPVRGSGTGPKRVTQTAA